MPIPDLSQIDLKLCVGMGIVLFFVFIFIMSRPRDTTWIEHCPHCNAELGSKFKGERPAHCKKCGHDIYYTKPHASK
jgi:hypothetical protein